ncbi:MAG TPA: CARDB domain-containing protein [Candidatus Thermoplasmatota archaeon]|nr:CARDB domain-containing protein [Candidatus Thermoplasmatota archaeon]
MKSPLVPLLGSSFRTWLSSKGFWLVAFAGLLPLVFTGAWVGTHRADVTAEGLEVPSTIAAGDVVTLTATIRNDGPVHVGPFNATLAVGRVVGENLVSPVTNVTPIDGLAPGETRTVSMQWTATGGFQYAVAMADQEDVLAEVDEWDNQAAKPIAVGYAPASAADAPAAPDAVRGEANASETADFAVASLRRGEVRPGQPATLEAVVENRGAQAGDVTVVVRVGQSFGGTLFPRSETRTNVTLEPGQQDTVTLQWAAAEGAWWHEAWVEPPAGASEATPEDNHRAEAFTANPQVPADAEPPALPEKLTIKEFYLSVLELLHLRILLPFLALFYAGGVIADERERGALPYVLTRPLPRWLIPITKFVASFAVAALVTVLGLVLTYLLLFGSTPQGADVGFLLTPILASLLTLFAYGALFTLVGVWYPRPYLVGVAWVLGWENVAYNFVPIVRNLTLRQHIENALLAWPLDQGATWVPTDANGVRAILVLLAAGAALLVAASSAMKKREFEV